MEDNIEVSVIMGVYNIMDEKQLRSAITSIQNQSFHKWEFIICDDGSDNGTYDMIKKIADSDKRICVIQYKENKGLAYALNQCIKKAKGKYIARMDADDIDSSSRLTEEKNFLDAHMEYQFVGTGVELIDSASEVWGERRMAERPLKTNFLFGSPFIHPTVMFRREALEAVGGYRVAKETKRVEDYDLFMRLYAAGYQGYNIQKLLYQFREDEEALKRKKYRYRIDEVKIRYKGFKALGLLPRGVLYLIKPLIVGLIPYSLLVALRGDRKK